MQSIKYRCGGFVTNLHLLKVIINVELLKGGHLLILWDNPDCNQPFPTKISTLKFPVGKS